MHPWLAPPLVLTLRRVCCSPPSTGVSAECLQGIHELNGIFLAARSYQEAQEAAHQVLAVAAVLEPHSLRRPLIAVLASVVAACELPSVLALHCLIFLASASPQAQEDMAAHGLVALLVGQLLGAADSLEPALQVASLQLLQLLAVGNPRRIVNGSSLGAVLRVVAGCLHDRQPIVSELGLQILQELAYSHKVLYHEALTSRCLPALEALVQTGSNGKPELVASASKLHKLLLSLPVLMKPPPSPAPPSSCQEPSPEHKEPVG